MGKSKKSLLTAVTAILLTGVNGLIGLFITKYIIEIYGSDFNGLNSTTTQFINMLLIVEGGFTLATNVALFDPLSKKDYLKVNGILSATKNIFKKIGVTFFIIGTIFSLCYTFMINSNLSTGTIFLVFFMAVFSTSFNLFYSVKYKILLQSEQREYILNIIQIVTIIISQLGIILIIYFNKHMLLIRLCVMVGAILNSFFIAFVCKRSYKFINFKVDPLYSQIKGTKDVFAQKITTMMYQTIPILFISATLGTVIASIYMIYNNVFSLLKNVLYSFINAPQMGFGRLIKEKSNKYVKKIFFEYEFIVIVILGILLSTCQVLIIPFIKLFTVKMTDANYVDNRLAILFVIITFLEIVHIPSGVIINMSGRFEISKKIQILASIILVLSMFVLNQLYSFYGILTSIIIAATILAVFEIVYVHKIFFENSLLKFVWITLTNIVLFFISINIQTKMLGEVTSYQQFFLKGSLLVIFNSMFFLIMNIIFNKNETVSVLKRITRLVKK